MGKSMKILKAGDPCPCCGRPIPAGLPEWKMVVLGYIAEGMALHDAITTAKQTEEVQNHGKE